MRGSEFINSESDLTELEKVTQPLQAMQLHCAQRYAVWQFSAHQLRRRVGKQKLSTVAQRHNAFGVRQRQTARTAAPATFFGVTSRCAAGVDG